MEKSRKRLVTIAASTIGAVAVAGGAFWIVDASIAAHAERNLSKAVAESADLENDPRVFLGSSIYSTAFFTGELDSVSIDMLDVEIPGVGMVNARTEVENVEVSRDQILSGDLDGTTAETFTRTLRMDGVAIGAQLGITDLDISHPIDISPSGGIASEALLTGTPPDMEDPVSVLVTLRLVGSEFQMLPYELIDAPSGLTLDDVAPDFTWKIDTLQLPLADRAMAVYLSGGSVHFQSEARNVQLTTRELSPLAAPEENSDES
ncbi:LmeA family phospholipid-binding protein [Corynebacterium glutamicum]|uniref:LmeA family phospholipid-binding protein n=1 Tax=Corynebacterium glutamicum TaxID=1718 RepID=UPI001467CBBA|nr:DUF2993 domain-containing protein [Corynebacterium glutamicum]GFK19860.1 hypothetical protein KbCgl_24320 [Corynebacterium glutamicum]